MSLVAHFSVQPRPGNGQRKKVGKPQEDQDVTINKSLIVARSTNGKSEEAKVEGNAWGLGQGPRLENRALGQGFKPSLGQRREVGKPEEDYSAQWCKMTDFCPMSFIS